MLPVIVPLVTPRFLICPVLPENKPTMLVEYRLIVRLEMAWFWPSKMPPK